MSDRFCTVLAVHSAHRRGAAVDAAQRLADNASIPLTSFDIAERGQADLVRTARSHDVQEIASAIKSRAGALLVVDALGGGPDADWLYDDDAEHLLANVPLPTLVFGPHATLDITRLILLVAADASGTTTASVAAAAVWAATFDSTAIVVALDAPDPWPADGADPTVDPPRQLAAALADTGVTVELQRRRTFDPGDALTEAAADVPGGVLVIPAARFPSDHWFSTSRRLIRHASRPVLLVPS